MWVFPGITGEILGRILDFLRGLWWNFGGNLGDFGSVLGRFLSDFWGILGDLGFFEGIIGGNFYDFKVDLVQFWRIGGI